ncbi:hypothetical protein, partial [Nocardia asiatica]|uniref:hypothetical protein n=1 Tax=Nocardia asiatica TaxID=209252 RepID=UPI002454E785
MTGKPVAECESYEHRSLPGGGGRGGRAGEPRSPQPANPTPGTPQSLYHYTNQTGHDAILESQELRPSIREHNPK